MRLRPGEMLRVSGFGRTKPMPPEDRNGHAQAANSLIEIGDLKLVDLPYLPDKICASKYSKFFVNKLLDALYLNTVKPRYSAPLLTNFQQ